MTGLFESKSPRTASAVGLGARGENLSILIPTFNCAKYLRETLESLKQQGSAIDEAQIEIVDDCSTKDDPEAAAREVWGDRVTLFRHPQNVGATRNFNACLERARQPWIHILHGDDIVMPGAYVEFNKAIQTVPDAIAVFAQCLYVNAKGIRQGVTDPLGPDSLGKYKYKPLEWHGNPLQFAGVLVSGEAIQTVGKFNTQFVHAADFNLWWRLAKTGRVAYVNQCVGGYRMFEGNHSSTLLRGGRNLWESIEQAKLAYADYLGSGSARKFWMPHIYQIVRQSRQFIDDPEAFAQNAAVLNMLPSGSVPRRFFWQLRLERLIRNLRLRR